VSRAVIVVRSTSTSSVSSVSAGLGACPRIGRENDKGSGFKSPRELFAQTRGRAGPPHANCKVARSLGSSKATTRESVHLIFNKISSLDNRIRRWLSRSDAGTAAPSSPHLGWPLSCQVVGLLGDGRRRGANGLNARSHVRGGFRSGVGEADTGFCFVSCEVRQSCLSYAGNGRGRAMKDPLREFSARLRQRSWRIMRLRSYVTSTAGWLRGRAVRKLADYWRRPRGSLPGGRGSASTSSWVTWLIKRPHRYQPLNWPRSRRTQVFFDVTARLRRAS